MINSPKTPRPARAAAKPHSAASSPSRVPSPAPAPRPPHSAPSHAPSHGPSRFPSSRPTQAGYRPFKANGAHAGAATGASHTAGAVGVSHSGAPRSGGSRPFRPHNGPGGHANKRGISVKGKFASASQSNETAAGPVPEGTLRFAALGGLEEIGRNCSFFEYGDSIVVVDVGIQFPEEATPGIDYIIPNVEYLANKKQNVAGIILTHGHYDHIAAIHYVLEKLGNPIIYASAFARSIVERRHAEFPNAPKLKFVTVKEGMRVKLSESMTAEFFAVEHTIPESYGFILETPVGNMVNCGDFRLDYDKDGTPRQLDIFKKLGDKKIHTAFLDSTNANIAGHVPSEETVADNLEVLIKNAKGRIIIATFSSLVDRLIEAIKIAGIHGRKVAVNGRSMKENLETAKALGYLKDEKGVIIPLEEIGKYKDEKIMILTTGSQGEANAGLMRIVNGDHRVVQLKMSDTVVFSSSVVPGNERSVQSLQDNISRQVDELYNSSLLDIHASGHCQTDDLKIVLDVLKPQFVVPIHGYYFKRKAFVKIAAAVGREREMIKMMDNGQVASLTKDSFTITKDTVPASYVMVDGLGVGDVEEVVLRDRRNLAQEGMVVIITTMDHNGRLVKSPDIISRGFIYLKENQTILDEIRKRINGLLERIPSNNEADPDFLKNLIRDQISQFLYNKTKRRPMVLPVIIEI
jgi:ribonuclease J